MPPQNTPANQLLAGTAIVVGTYALMLGTDKVLDKMTRSYTKFQAKKTARAWLRTWKEIDDLPTVEN